jgi:cyanate permease
VALGTASLAGIAVLAHRWEVLAAFLAVGGLALATLQPSADLWVTRNVPRHRHGVTYGVKQSAAPVAALAAGLAVPALVIPFGWRAGYAAAAVVAVVVLLLVPADAAGGRRGSRAGDAGVGALAVIALSYGLGNAGAVVLGGFFVSHAVRGGVPEAVAGTLFAASSLGVVLTRVVIGHLADRRAAGPFTGIPGLQLAGAGCCLLFAFSGGAGVYVFGPLAMVTAWGWLGLLALSVVRANPNAPAAATGITQTGGYVGAGLGPVGFGLVARSHSYHGAWVLAACSLCLGAVAMLAGRRMLRAQPAAAAPGRGA